MTASTVKMPPPGGADRLEFNMTQVHNIIKSGYTSIVSRLDNPPMDDLGNFLGYCEAWVNTVDVHHHIEGPGLAILLEQCAHGATDAKIFAFLSSNLDFSKESAQHALIHIELDALLNTFRAAKADRSKFDPQALKIAMTAFQPTLVSPLRSSRPYPDAPAVHSPRRGAQARQRGQGWRSLRRHLPAEAARGGQ
jgi:hypothetical protein